MKKKKHTPVRVLVAGTCLSLSASACKSGGAEPRETTPVVGEASAGPTSAGGASTSAASTPPPPIISNPPPPARPALPSWDDVASGHPAGATNPPSPFLVVTPDGRCYKEWRGMMKPRPGQPHGDRVDECVEGDDCGTPIVCPQPKASQLLEAHAKSSKDDAANSGRGD